MNIIDLDIYRATKIRVPYDEPLGKYLHDLDKANRAVEELLEKMSWLKSEWDKP